MLTMLPKHESLGIFSLVVPQGSCIASNHTLSRSCNWKLHLLLTTFQVTCCVKKLTTLWFVYSMSLKAKNVYICKPCADQPYITQSYCTCFCIL